MNQDRQIKSGSSPADQNDNLALNWSQTVGRYQVERQETENKRQTDKGEMCQLPPGLRQKTYGNSVSVWTSTYVVVLGLASEERTVCDVCTLRRKLANVDGGLEGG